MPTFKRYLQNKGERDADNRRHDLVLSLFNSYNESYYKQEVQRSASVKEFGSKLSGNLAGCENEANKAMRKSIIIGIIALIIVFLLTNHNTPAARTFRSFGVLVTYLMVLIYPWRRIGRLNEERAVRWLFQAIRELEVKSDNWRSSNFRYSIAKRVESVAIVIERIPLGFHDIAPIARQDIINACKARALGLRQLEASIIMPNSLTLADLIERLKSAMWCIADDRWYELPEGQPTERVRSRWMIVVQATSAIIFIGLSIFVATLAPKIGNYASIAAVSLLTVGLVILNRSGLLPGYLTDALGQAEN